MRDDGTAANGDFFPADASWHCGKKAGNAQRKKSAANAALKEAYEAIGEMAASFDYDSVQYVLENLAGYRFPAEESVRYQAIRQAARIPDWEKLTSLLAKDRKGD